MAKFSVAARTLVHLGAELITSDEVALNELIKNAFDADSDRVRIDFNIGLDNGELDQLLAVASEETNRPLFSEFLDGALAKLTAHGNSADGNATRSQRLVSRLESCQSWSAAVSMLESVNQIVVSDRGSGMTAQELETVFLRIGTPSRLQMHKSSQLQRTILGNKGIGRLAMMRLGDRAIVTSWTDKKHVSRIVFDWRLFDEPDKSLEEISIEVENVKGLKVEDSGTIVQIDALHSPWTKELVETLFVGRFLRRLQNPFMPASKQGLFPIDVHYNHGPRIPIAGMSRLLREHVQIEMELEFNAVDRSLNDTVVTTTLTDHQRGIDPQVLHRTLGEVMHLAGATQEDLSSTGPFTARIRWFNRATLRTQQTLQGNVRAALAELNLWNGGVAIYRDGFRVGFSGDDSGEDWLKLDSSALKRSGFTVNRIQVVGALEITRKDNPELVDRSNREGLIESRQSNVVREILRLFAIAELRRHVQHEGQEEKRVQLDFAAKSAPESIRARIKQAEQGLAEIREYVPKDAKETVRSIAHHLHFIKTEAKRFEEAAKQVGERREDILELAGVGTVMAGILHELTRTTAHTRQLMQKIAKTESGTTKELLVKLDNEIKAINTRLRQLDPLTPSGRHHKEEFDLTALLQTVINGYEARFERHEIYPSLRMSDGGEPAPFMVTMVRGFVSLAVENLITNSIYWLQRGMQAGARRREIIFELDPASRTLTIADNGPGISSADRGRVFTAGFTMRPRGQGLGLFIAAEVATYHHARLLLDSADRDGRHRTFVLELPKE